MYLGQALPMRDALDRVSGNLKFTLNHTVPGMAHARVLRSPVPHARIRGIDAAEALAIDGVIAILTGEDLGPGSGVNPYFGGARDDQPVVAIDKVRYVGDAVAVIVAESERIAAEALQMIDVDYEELPYVVDAEESSKPGAPSVHEQWPDNACGDWKLRFGDIEQGWRESDRIYEHVFYSPTAHHVPMEPHVAVAQFEDSGRVNVWTAAQSPYAVHSAIVKLLNTTDEQVRVGTFNLGGGYGGKGGVKIEPMVVCAARKAGRPVRLELTREEVFQTICKHAARVWIKTGVKHDGTLVARQIDIVWNAGAYAVSSLRASRQGMVRAPGPYRIPHVHVDSRAFYSNSVPSGPFRGAMTSQVCWAYESQLDEIAADLGIDPVEIRRRNLLRDGDTYATGETFPHAHYHDLLDEVKTAIDWNDEDGVVHHRPQENGKVVGKGVALMIKHTITPSRSEGKLEYRDDGSCVLYSSSVEMGQGARTTLPQYVADQLGVPLERIELPFPDTSITPYDLTTSSSRTAYSMSFALREAGDDLRRQLRELAAVELEASEADIEASEGKVWVAGSPERNLSWEALLSRAGRTSVIGEGVFESPPGYGVLDDKGQGIATVHWHEGAVGVEVEVDMETGHVDILRCHASSYAGHVMNPVIVRQQLEGNVIYGLGPAMFEECVFDNGQLVNPNLSDYMIPSLMDIPKRMTSHPLESEDPNADIHGVGEMTVPVIAPAIRNAIFRATGAKIYDLPMNAERVYRAIHEHAEVERGKRVARY